MGSTSAAPDTPLARLTDFLARYPETKYLRLVFTTYSGQQQCKSVPIHHARLFAAGSTTLVPGTETPLPAGEPGGGAATGKREDSRGVIPGALSCVNGSFVLFDDVGGIDFMRVEVGDTTLQIDWTTLVPILAEPAYGFVSCSLYHSGELRTPGYGYDADPRIVLERVVRTAKEKHGMEFTTGAELEFTLFDEKDLNAPLAEPRTALFANQHGTRGQKILEESVDALEHAGVHVWSFHPESGTAGQMELQLFPNDPSTTADHTVFAQHVIRNIATRHGCIATFAAAPAPGGGTGRHIHLGLSRPETDMNFIAGLLHHLPALFLVLQASIDGSEARSITAGPNALWATTKWGPLHYKYPGRMEVRTPDAHFSVHLQLAAIIAAGLDGVDKQVLPKQKESIPIEDLRNYVMSRSGSAVKADIAKKYELDQSPLPKDFGESIDKFKEEKDFWVTALGERVVEGILTVQEGKWNNRHSMTKEERRVKTIQTFA